VDSVDSQLGLLRQKLAGRAGLGFPLLAQVDIGPPSEAVLAFQVLSPWRKTIIVGMSEAIVALSRHESG